MLYSPGDHSPCHYHWSLRHRLSLWTKTETTISLGGSQPSSLVSGAQAQEGFIQCPACLFQFTFLASWYHFSAPLIQLGARSRHVSSGRVSELNWCQSQCLCQLSVTSDCLSHQADQRQETNAALWNIFFCSFAIFCWQRRFWEMTLVDAPDISNEIPVCNLSVY